MHERAPVRRNPAGARCRISAGRLGRATCAGAASAAGRPAGAVRRQRRRMGRDGGAHGAQRGDRARRRLHCRRARTRCAGHAGAGRAGQRAHGPIWWRRPPSWVSLPSSRCCASARWCAWRATVRCASASIGRRSRRRRPSNVRARACRGSRRCCRSSAGWPTLEQTRCRVLLSPRADAEPLPGRGGRLDALVTLSGPEGGLAPDEETAAREKGFVATRLGPSACCAPKPRRSLRWPGSAMQSPSAAPGRRSGLGARSIA